MNWILPLILLVIGAFFIIVNWSVFYYGMIKEEYHSWVPLVGGVFASVGLGTLPVEGVKSYWWMPSILDYGSLPGLSYTAWFFLTGKHKQ